MNYNHLIKRKSGNLAMGQRWSLNNISDGIHYFFDLHKHYPTQKEFDEFNYLPSVRQIEKKYGGLVKLRKILNIPGEIDFSKGDHRSAVAKKMYQRARDYEEDFYNYLISIIPEVNVHEHKVIRPGRISSDFFIYTDNNNGIVIDLFFAQDRSCLIQTINYKQKKYLILPFLIFFIAMDNDMFTQEQVDELLKNKKNALPVNIKVFTESYFKSNINKLLKIEKA